jgi:hypothetical protein
VRVPPPPARLSDVLLGVPLGPARNQVPPISTNPPRAAADEAELGRLALFLLNAFGPAFAVIPAHRRDDTRRLFALFATRYVKGYPMRGASESPLWARLVALPDDQLDDVVGRARVAHALVDDG